MKIDDIIERGMELVTDTDVPLTFIIFFTVSLNKKSKIKSETVIISSINKGSVSDRYEQRRWVYELSEKPSMKEMKGLNGRYEDSHGLFSSHYPLSSRVGSPTGPVSPATRGADEMRPYDPRSVTIPFPFTGEADPKGGVNEGNGNEERGETNDMWMKGVRPVCYEYEVSLTPYHLSHRSTPYICLHSSYLFPCSLWSHSMDEGRWCKVCHSPRQSVRSTPSILTTSRVRRSGTRWVGVIRDGTRVLTVWFLLCSVVTQVPVSRITRSRRVALVTRGARSSLLSPTGGDRGAVR